MKTEAHMLALCLCMEEKKIARPVEDRSAHKYLEVGNNASLVDDRSACVQALVNRKQAKKW